MKDANDQKCRDCDDDAREMHKFFLWGITFWIAKLQKNPHNHAGLSGFFCTFATRNENLR
jgi:hypothetical protein